MPRLCALKGRTRVAGADPVLREGFAAAATRPPPPPPLFFREGGRRGSLAGERARQEREAKSADANEGQTNRSRRYYGAWLNERHRCCCLMPFSNTRKALLSQKGFWIRRFDHFDRKNEKTKKQQHLHCCLLCQTSSANEGCRGTHHLPTRSSGRSPNARAPVFGGD
jgi:hypothetical protein